MGPGAHLGFRFLCSPTHREHISASQNQHVLKVGHLPSHTPASPFPDQGSLGTALGVAPVASACEHPHSSPVTQGAIPWTLLC